MTTWRIRLNYHGRDFSKAAWEIGQVGIWYGAWSADDFANAPAHIPLAQHLDHVPAHRALQWSGPVTPFMAATIKRFASIPTSDTVLLHFEGQLCLGRLQGPLTSNAEHPLNQDGELFKFRQIVREKTFEIRRLPDAFRLLPSAARGNVFRVRAAAALLAILLQSSDESEVVRRIGELSWPNWLLAMGPKSWESICLGYLILMTGFLPTALVAGGELAVFDLVGRTRCGRRVLAQCKKGNTPEAMGADFAAEALTPLPDTDYFYFAYAGCSGSPPDDVHLVTGPDIERWFDETEIGRSYRTLLK